MGFWSKESKTHFVRDEEGQVVKVERSGDEPKRGWFQSKTPVSDSLEKQYYSEHPEERHKTLKKIGSVAKKVDRRIVDYNRRSNPIGRKPSRSYRPSRGSPLSNNFNPFGSTFDRGVTPMRKPKSKGKTKYAVIKGKAYPIAGTGKKKRSKKKSRSKGDAFSFDFGGWGL